MKRTLLIAALILPTLAFAQTTLKSPLPIDSTTNMVTYQEVVQVPGVSKEELYNRANNWLFNHLKSTGGVFQGRSAEDGKLIGKSHAKGSIKYALATVPMQEDFTISITVKEGRYRYELSGFSVKNTAARNAPGNAMEEYVLDPKWRKNETEFKKIAQDMIDLTTKTSSELLPLLKDAMAKTAPASKDDF